MNPGSTDDRRYRLIAIELDDGAGPRRRPDRPNLYLGVTSIDPKDRYEQMRRSTKRHQLVRDHAVRLRTDLTRNYPATDLNDVRRQKRKLTEKLMRKGYTVNRNTKVWRLYVIELGETGTHPKPPHPPWVYVGETSREIEERFRQHVTGARNRKTPLYSRVVYRNGGRLRPDLYAHLPELYTSGDAKRAERALADRLAAEGYRVEGGH